MIRVLKIGGRAQNDPNLASAVHSAAAENGIVVVHGGGDEVSALQRRMGMTWSSIGCFVDKTPLTRNLNSRR